MRFREPARLLTRVMARLSPAVVREWLTRGSTPRRLLERYLSGGALVLSVLTFGGYAMGLVRDRIFARTFGVGGELDAYNAAFVLPELTLDVVVASGLTAPFVPIFLQLRRDGADAERFAQTIVTAAVVVMAAASAVMFVAAPATASLVAPGFGPEQREQYVGLFRTMLLTPVIFAASFAVGEVLVAERRFVSYGLAPLMYNAGIVIGTVALSARIGIHAAAAGAVAGALLHLGTRLWGLRRSTVRVRLAFAVRTRAVREFARLMLPKMAGQPIEPATFLYFTLVASTLGAGSVTAVSFARNFQSVPVSLIGVAFSLAAFPALSSAHAAGDRRRFVRTLGANLVTVSVLTAAAGAFLFAFSRWVISTLLGGGAMDGDAVALTSATLSAFAVSVPFESLTQVLSRAIYATRHTLLQVVASLASLGVTVVATALLAPLAGVVAIPIGFTVGMAVKVVLLAAVVAWRLRRAPRPLRSE
ncbi:MAG: MATE family efflux transporter [Chloroflexota bacterium]|nr:MATE family efflux transporter [Chloroflexota bacterium]